MPSIFYCHCLLASTHIGNDEIADRQRGDDQNNRHDVHHSPFTKTGPVEISSARTDHSSSPCPTQNLSGAIPSEEERPVSTITTISYSINFNHIHSS